MSVNADSTRKSDENFLGTARKRLTTAMSTYSSTRQNQLDDLKFYAGSPDNNWQWPTEALATRQDSTGQTVRPCLTINKLPQHVKQVTNDQRQNRPAGKCIPTSDDAHIEVADMFDDVVRHIEYDSEADLAYDTACETQVIHGEGYWRILTEYEDEDSFDQKAVIELIENPFSVYMDPMMKKPTGEGSQWAFILEDLAHEEFEAQFPDATPISSIQQSGAGDSTAWIKENTIRIAEYFYIETSREKLWRFRNGKSAFEGTPEYRVYIKHLGEPIDSRMSDRKKVKWCKTNGYEVLEEREWPGKYIPIVRVIGNQFKIEGEIYISGIVRNAKDPQRMYNYHSSNEVEMIALAPKAPFIGAGGQFDGYQDKWKNANLIPYPYLEYNPDVADGNGTPLPPPQRMQPPMLQQGIIAAKQAASEDVKETTGQYNASLGQQSNERSGKAILARQHEGDVSTFHYVDNLARAVRYSTRILIDLIPKIYDTKRIVQIRGEDGTAGTVQFDPDQQHPVVNMHDNGSGLLVAKSFNPAIGKYGVAAVTGPGYATKRQEALNAMAQLLESNPELWHVAGDLFVKNMDWPGAQELAKRFAKTLDPRVLQDNPAMEQATQQIQQLTQELQQAHMMLQNAHGSIEAREVAVKEQDTRIAMFDAQTKRIAALAAAAKAATQDQAIQTPEQIEQVVMGILHAAIASGDVQGSVPGLAPGQDPTQAVQQPQEAPPALDPNKVLTEVSKHALQDKQHAHEADMAEKQAQQAAQQPQEGSNAGSTGP